MNLTEAFAQQDLHAIRQAGREALTHFREKQFEAFDTGTPASFLIKERSHFIDQLLKQLWHYFELDALSLIAVGGYGRGELHPYSDIDVLIIADAAQQKQHEASICAFQTLLWDWGLDIGASVRSLASCEEEGRKDVTVATSLLEARWITGAYEPFQALLQLWKAADFWPAKDFYLAKVAEQETRREKVQGTLYQLEPNLKTCPGGLRDIQTIYWVAKRILGASALYDLLQHAMLTPQEHAQLDAANKTLNRFRFALHRHKKRREDRLLFDHQQLLATELNAPGDTLKQQVEHLMHSFYRTTQQVIRLNEVLLAHFRETLFDQHHPAVALNQRFQTVNDFLEIKDPALFEQNPTTILEAFLLFTYHPQLKGMRAGTLRALSNHLDVVDEAFRHDAIHKTLFLALLRQPQGVYHSLKYMHKYGVLARYIPQFGHITGLMQFNLFHAYPVDEHTLLVLRNLRRFFIEDHAWEFPTAHQISKQIQKPEILFLAGLFHDITKGNEPHAITGAAFAEQWCAEHNLPEQDVALVSWLVRHHLDFSDTAQKSDLSDPEVIAQFAEKVGDQKRLDHLYLLTLADVLSTSPDVWNDWKNALFLELYRETSRMLVASQAQPKDIANKSLQHQELARELLKKQGVLPEQFAALWHALAKTEFFYRQPPGAIVRITRQILERGCPVIQITPQPQKGASEIMLYTEDRDFLFAQITKVLEQQQLSIMEAQIYCLPNGNTLTLFYVLDQHTRQAVEHERAEAIKTALQATLNQPIDPAQFKLAQPTRKQRCFITPTKITFKQKGAYTELFLSTLDLPGLLAKVAWVFVENDLRLHDARITTVGEKVEDTFIISRRDQQPLTEEALKALYHQLMESVSCIT